jgi:FkbM family methyltransferase
MNQRATVESIRVRPQIALHKGVKMSALRALLKKVIPRQARGFVRSFLPQVSQWLSDLRSLWRQADLWDLKDGSVVNCGNYKVRIALASTYSTLYKEIFIYNLYQFRAQRLDPLIIDCGSNIGLTLLYFKSLYPESRLIAFEPDPAIFPYLRENIQNNRIEKTELHNAALGEREGILPFLSDGHIGSCLVETAASDIPSDWKRYDVPCVRLSQYLKDHVDLLKMNIEGAEWQVLSECREHLNRVQQIMIEYHHLPGLPRTLHSILELLDKSGFEYLVSDFGLKSYGTPRPPVSLRPDNRYFRFVYACRREIMLHI